jgi:hypothetical protein
MEAVRNRIYALEDEVKQLRSTLSSFTGVSSTPTTHYVTHQSEFGQFSLEEHDTFRWQVQIWKDGAMKKYSYNLFNADNVLKSKFQLGQGIQIPPEEFEDYMLKKGGLPATLNVDQQHEIKSKLWEYRVTSSYEQPQNPPVVEREFKHVHRIPFKHAYSLSPHVNIYVTPFEDSGVQVRLHAITTTFFEFEVTYPNPANSLAKNATLHYAITGPIAIPSQDLLLD